MITLPLGFLFSLGIVYFALHGVDAKIFMNLHSFVIVVVGTIGVSFLSSTKVAISDLTKGILGLFKKEHTDSEVFRSIYDLSNNRKKAVGHAHPLVAFAQDLWEQGVDDEMFDFLLERRLDELNSKEEGPVTLLRNLTKYPPALGMMGTVMGMVQLFANLTTDNKNSVGSNLALAMTATFYGLLLSNLLITPLSDRLHNKYVAHAKRNETVFNALLLINRNEPLSIVENCATYRMKNEAA